MEGETMNGLSHWDKIKHFKPSGTTDNWGDPHKISKELLRELDAFRSYIGMPVHVTSGYRVPKSPRETDSQHHYGQAADIVIPDFKGTLLDLFLVASRFNFKGIGVYRDWKWNDKPTGGLHVDTRRGVIRAQWFCYKNSDGIQIYAGMTQDVLKEHGVLA